MANGRIDQLEQLMTVTWDGNLISKTDRDVLVEKGYAYNNRGWNVITGKGLDILDDLGLINPPSIVPPNIAKNESDRKINEEQVSAESEKEPKVSPPEIQKPLSAEETRDLLNEDEMPF